MTVVTFFSQEHRISGFSVEGHSGLAEEGQDILCAAITSSVRLVEASLNDVLGLKATVKVREAYVSLKLPSRGEDLGELAESTCQTILAGMMVYFLQLAEEYPSNLTVLEEEL